MSNLIIANAVYQSMLYLEKSIEAQQQNLKDLKKLHKELTQISPPAKTTLVDEYHVRNFNTQMDVGPYTLEQISHLNFEGYINWKSGDKVVAMGSNGRAFQLLSSEDEFLLHEETISRRVWK